MDIFKKKLVNRLEMPEKHILVCEDDLTNQAKIAIHMAEILPYQGKVQVSYVSSGLAAAYLIQGGMTIDLILLDHDMPDGGGDELMIWLKNNKYDIPVITFSGIPSNNERLVSLGAKYHYHKFDVINGIADNIIKGI